ncbi:MAG: ATP-dependent DNA helicase [Patescibacteria group bacterium]
MNLEALNAEQRKAVVHDRGPLLIVAGAGTGKTTVLTQRYAWLILEKKLAPDNLLALTFTDKAAEEMENRVLQLLPNGTYDFWISTFHSFCQRILERHALEIGLPNDFKILNETDGWLLLKRHINELPLDHYRPLGNPVKFLSALIRHFSRAKDEGVTAERYQEFAQNCILDGDSEVVDGERKKLKELADCYFAYQRILREEGCLDFGDLIVETLRVLRERPAILDHYRKRFKYILIDEFQDTNWAQYEMVKLLAGDEKNITVVGDDDQAIYKFRGASLANILQFRDDFPDTATVALTDNYRSTQNILDHAYGFIKNNDPYRLEVKLSDEGISKALRSFLDKTGTVNARWYPTLEDEAASVIDEIIKKKDVRQDLSWNDFAILVRSNESATPFINELDNCGVPYCFYALRGLYAKPSVLDLTAFFSVCIKPFESTAVWRTVTAPCFDFTNAEAAELLHLANQNSLNLWKTLERAAMYAEALGQAGVEKAAKFVKLFNELQAEARRATPLKMLHSVLEKTGYLHYLLQGDEAKKIESLNILKAFEQRLKRYETAAREPTLKNFLEEFQLEIDSGEKGELKGDPEAGPEQVKVMTVHTSKGLEFSYVYVVSLVDQRFPTRERSDAIMLPDGLVNERLPEGDTHLEEERRLMYVAMTRAKEYLTLTGAANYGGSRPKKPSVFFQEIGLQPEDMAVQGSQIRTAGENKNMAAFKHEEKDLFKLKRRFSFTQLAAFNKCPLQYKFAHLYRIPILGSYNRSFGQAMHLALHDILQLHLDRLAAKQGSLFAAPPEIAPEDETTGFKVTIDEALEIYELRWHQNDYWYPSEKAYEDHYKEGRAAVRRMCEAWQVAVPAVKYLELPFEWKAGEHSLKGSIDRIDELDGGGIAIYDYKTGQAKAGDKLVSSDKEQLHIYQLAVEGRGLSVKKLCYVYVRSGLEVEVELLQGEKRGDFILNKQRQMDEILSSDFAPSPSTFICKYCDFRNICEFRKL